MKLLTADLAYMYHRYYVDGFRTEFEQLTPAVNVEYVEIYRSDLTKKCYATIKAEGGVARIQSDSFPELFAKIKNWIDPWRQYCQSPTSKVSTTEEKSQTTAALSSGLLKVQE